MRGRPIIGRTRRSDYVQGRVEASERTLLVRAAKATGSTLSRFLIDAGLQKARRILRQQKEAKA